MAAKVKADLLVDLPNEHVRWLEGKAVEHELPDAGKAFRCALMFVVSKGRPLSLEGVRAMQPGAATTRLAIPLAPQQLSWVHEEVQRAGEGASSSLVAAAVCDACIAAESADVFGVIRCKTGAVASGDACDGARAALLKQRERQQAAA